MIQFGVIEDLMVSFRYGEREIIMRILWVCNLVLPEFSDEFHIKSTCYGGWMSGMLYQLEQIDGLVIGLCFPIIDEERMKKSVYNHHPYYSFHASVDYGNYQGESIKEFLEILEDFNPDVVHIWGTEYNHARAMMDACIQRGMGNRTLIHIQGLVSYYTLHYTLGIDSQFLADRKSNSIIEGKNFFFERGKTEKHLLKQAMHVSGRTEWDRACCFLINSNACYYGCNEILRKEFYQTRSLWASKYRQKHRIFLSQASYPVKGLHFFLKAMDVLRRKISDFEVYIGGHSPLSSDSKDKFSSYGKYLQSLLEKYRLENQVHFLGNLTADDMLYQFLHAHAFVSPSTIENSSNSVCEAMLLGVPVIASYVGGTPSLIQHGTDGFLYPCDAHYMLAYYVMQIFQDDVLAERISREARKTALERHNPGKIRKRMLEIYRAVASA